jgi:ubiquitin-protein ligase
MSTVRLRRLAADFSQLEDYARRHPRLRLIQSDGDPPERYQIEYRVRSLRQVDGELLNIKSHIVEIVLPRGYPRVPPQCRMLTPVFHPNIAPHAICVGDHWSAGESLKSIVVRIGEILAYQTYNVKSPLNGEAARWVEEHEDELPLDNVSLLVEEPASDEIAASVTPPSSATLPRPKSTTFIPSPNPPSGNTATESSDRDEVSSTVDRPSWMPSKPRAADSSTEPVKPAATETVSIPCPQCGTKYRVPMQSLGRRAECRTCHTVFVLSSPGPS